MYHLPVYRSKSKQEMAKATIFIRDNGNLAVCNPSAYRPDHAMTGYGERSVINMTEYLRHLRGVWEDAIAISLA